VSSANSIADEGLRGNEATISAVGIQASWVQPKRRPCCSGSAGSRTGDEEHESTRLVLKFGEHENLIKGENGMFGKRVAADFHFLWWPMVYAIGCSRFSSIA